MPSYDQRGKDKTWSVRFRVKLRDGTTQNKRLSGYRTKKEAQRAYVEYMAEQGSAVEDTPDDRLNFDDLLADYLAHQRTRIKPSSVYSIESKINQHIAPYFAGRVVDEITPRDILAWQQSLESYSYKYKTGLRTQLSSIYKFGERYHDVKNIMSRVEGFRNLEPKKEMQFWTPDEFHTFLAVVDDPLYALYFRLLYTTGCRKGESLALTWDDVDFDEAKISITKSITRKTKDAPYAVTTPKNNASIRDVSIPQTLADDLRAWRDGMDEQDDGKFIFGGDDPFTDRSTDRRFAEWCKQSGVKKIRLHDFRHSCASVLIASGVSIVAVSRHLGHSNIEQTLNTYSHMMPSDADRMRNAFAGY